MKKFITGIVCCVLFFSCHQHEEKNKNGNVHLDLNSSRFKFQKSDQKKSKLIQQKAEKDTTIFATGEPDITPLPFGRHVNEKNVSYKAPFYSNLIAKDIAKQNGWTPKALKGIKIYKLPLIKKITYIGITSFPDSDKCIDGQPFGNFFKINKYRYRLPDFGRYKVYYWCDYEDYYNSGYSLEVLENCNWCILNFYVGYLIFYDPAAEVAKVIPIYFDTFADGEDLYRYFFIDQKYNILLTDFDKGGDSGDEDAVPTIGSVHSVSISKNGEIKINKVK